MHAIIDPDVSAEIGRLLNGDPLRICDALNQLRNDLENNPAALEYFRHDRDEERPDDYFNYSCHYISSGTWHHLDFLVSDKQALDGILLVDEVS
jgi:hypothetical protein